jgi:hypothetical protein
MAPTPWKADASVPNVISGGLAVAVWGMRRLRLHW